MAIAGSNPALDDAIRNSRKAQSENRDGKTWVQVMKQKAKPGT